MNDDNPPGTVILTGVVGSRAYGWATPESDTDRHGVFVMHPSWFLGVYPPHTSEFAFRRNPNWTDHEIGHFCRLALKCNPSALELLFLGRFEYLTDFGSDLVEMREAFLSSGAVKDTYLSYARQQIRRARKLPAGAPEEMRARARKSARHAKRLLDQGLSLYRTGSLLVEAGRRQEYYDFGGEAAKDPSLLAAELTAAERGFEGRSVLPEEPKVFLVGHWLRDMRVAML